MNNMAKDVIVVYGHPGVGKTFLCSMLNKNFIYCVDTDNLLKYVIKIILNNFKKEYQDTISKIYDYTYNEIYSDIYKDENTKKIWEKYYDEVFIPILNKILFNMRKKCQKMKKILVLVGISIRLNGEFLQNKLIYYPVKIYNLINEEPLEKIYRRMLVREYIKICENKENIINLINNYEHLDTLKDVIQSKYNIGNISNTISWRSFNEYVQEFNKDANKKGYISGNQRELTDHINEYAKNLFQNKL